MPPPRCPECGRFLKRAFVVTLSDDPTPCPRCGTGLLATMFDLDDPDLANVTTPAAPSDSVRPPDLAPDAVRDEPRDVLAGWDVGADPAELERWRDDRPPFPTDAVVVLGGGALGALVCALTCTGRRGRGAAFGGLAGALGAAVARQVWRLEP